MNYSVSYEAIHNLRVGFSGYWLQQTTDDKVNGVNVAHSLERTVGLGAGIQYFSGGDTWVHLNAYKETNVRNRAQGYSVTLRLSRGIPSSTAHPWTRLAEGFVYSRSTDVALPNHFPRIEKNQRWTRGNYA
jgi:Putative MetA-pathway of phenol degradation